MKAREEFINSIKETNKIFNEASPEQKRVMIAKDVITRIKVDLIYPRRGSLCLTEQPLNQNVANETTCNVCAKGGLLVAFVGRVNNFQGLFNSMGNLTENSAHTKLAELFSYEQLALIEFAFECQQFIGRNPITNEHILFDDKTKRKVRKFYNNYLTSKTRLRGICNNIIKNNGEFVL
jgi:hypothetical protein